MDNEINMDDGTPTDVLIASYVWNAGRFSVAFYNISTYALTVSNETFDLKPDFWHLKNLFRQTNVQTVLASGPQIFLKEVMNLFGMPKEADPSNYRLKNPNSTSAADFIVYTNNEKTLIANRKRILELKLPNMSAEYTELERSNFIGSVLPLDQNLVIESLGNLLNYIDINGKHLFLRINKSPVISSVTVKNLDSQLLVDSSTFDAMQVFAVQEHPSAFKRNMAGSSKEGLSLFRLINTCASQVGVNELKMILQQPTRDLSVLNLRYNTIEWFRDQQNALYTDRIRSYLKNIGNVCVIYGKLINSQGKPIIWKNLYKTVYYANSIGLTCKKLVENRANTVADTLLYKLGKYTTESNALQNVLEHMEYIIDFTESIKLEKFCVKFGLDPELDQMKETLLNVTKNITAKTTEEFKDLPDFVNELTIHFVHELGFLIAIPSMDIVETHPAFAENQLNFVYKTNESFFFKSPLCLQMSDEYGALYVNVCEREQQISDRLLEHICGKLSDLQYAVRICAQLDALMAVAKFTMTYNLTKPILVETGQVLQITEGRHILLDLEGKAVSNNTDIHVEKKNLINILIAPNASGKSVYLKQIAQIVYLAHIGSFVPARYAKMSLFDAIYTRIFSPETIYQAKSSFLIETQQMGNVMTNSSCYSLILIDELGRGTTAMDGKALLRSCLEHLVERAQLSPIAIVTTHYDDIYDIMANMEWISFKTFETNRNVDGSICSTFKLCDGQSVKNYARNCSEVKEFLNHLGGRDGGSDNGSITGDGIVNIANSIYQTKVTAAVRKLIDYIKKNQQN